MISKLKNKFKNKDKDKAIKNKDKDLKKKKKRKGLIKNFYHKMKRLYSYIYLKITSNIRMELIVTSGVCFLIALIFFRFANPFLLEKNRTSVVDYSYSVSSMREDIADIGKQISNLTQEEMSRENRENQKENNQESNEEDSGETMSYEEKLKQRVQSYKREYEKIIITDLNGKVLYKFGDIQASQIDMYTVFKNAMDTANVKQYEWVQNKDSYYDTYQGTAREFTGVYPIELKDKKAYLILNGVPQGSIRSYQPDGKSIQAVLLSVIVFILSFLLLTKKKVKYIEEISLGISEISKGNLDYRVNQKGRDELSLLSSNINFMAGEIKDKMERERRSEKTKNELITNVSHDLRTPLTSIIGYLTLIKNKKYENEKQMEEYLDIVNSKSEKLKVLIEELFEYTKLSNKGVTLKKETICINDFIKQLVEEFYPIFEENNLKAEEVLCEERLIVNVDIDKILRVFENLIMNSVRYSYKPGEIKVSMKKKEDKVLISITNKAKEIAQEDLDRIFERFYKVNKARTQNDEGSGLGLSIAKSIIDLHGGKIYAKSQGELVTFSVELLCEQD
ncbi:ATP-binding protein [Haloimpatiens sp. FM7330]|uniref:sensor histidine kinase n=1 Tax=Haloimpatiens sp. FM7330 TaxID=3298610 RepID=UPI003632277F